MSDIIQLLPDSVANQIAAGEVIQRPASVIKELVENSVDAGAKTINVLVVDAGKTSIQVIDDGKGMSETDARLSFERHATSKIRQADDLFSLSTMGFRGEALASIAAVSQIELKTRQEIDEVGVQLSIAGSKFVSQEPCSCAVGSNFLVENLFYNVPARRKFLKSNSTELNNILTAFERIALVYPNIHFTLFSNGTEMLNLHPGSFKQRIVDIFGKRLNQDLLPVKVDTNICQISGFVGKPESAKKRGAHQYFFVNGRYMKHAYFNKAVMTAFDRLIPMGEQIPYFIYFQVAPEEIDVNIHPTKTEIKFENEQAIWQILMASVKESIGIFSDVPTIDFDTEGKPDIPVYDPSSHMGENLNVKYNPSYNPFQATASYDASSKTSGSANWDKLYEGLKETEDTQEAGLFDSKSYDDIEYVSSSKEIIEEKSPAHYQYKGKYIMTAVKSGLMIIDQHRAHIRILYEKYLSEMEQLEMQSQKVLFPEVLQLPQSEVVVLQKIMPELEKMGLELTDLGKGSYSINSIPAGLDGINPITLVSDLVSSAVEKVNAAKDEIVQTLALSLARNAAIPQGQVLSNQEMENIVNQLFGCSNVNYTPDGKNVLCILKQDEIEHLLG